MTKRLQIDFLAAVGAALAFATTVLYSWKTSQVFSPMGLFRPFARGEAMFLSEQANRPVLWVLALLLGGTGLASYGARTHSRYPRTALLLAALVLLVMAGLAIFPYDAVYSIGVPLFASGLLCLVAAARRKQQVMDT